MQSGVGGNGDADEVKREGLEGALRKVTNMALEELSTQLNTLKLDMSNMQVEASKELAAVRCQMQEEAAKQLAAAMKVMGEQQEENLQRQEERAMEEREKAKEERQQ
jgi:hypothetical protein